MILVIGKPAEFNEELLPVRGQCQPQTPGWQLRAFEKGKEIPLYKSTYIICRRLQLQCRGLSLEEMKKKIAEFESTLMDEMEETACFASDRSNEKTVAFSETPTWVGDAPSSNAEDEDIDAPSYAPPQKKKRTKSFEK